MRAWFWFRLHNYIQRQRSKQELSRKWQRESQVQVSHPTPSLSSAKIWEPVQWVEWMCLFKIIPLTEAHYCFLLITLGGSYCPPVSGSTGGWANTAAIINTWKILESLFSFYSVFPRKSAAETGKSGPEINEDLLPSSRIPQWKEKTHPETSAD